MMGRAAALLALLSAPAAAQPGVAFDCLIRKPFDRGGELYLLQTFDRDGVPGSALGSWSQDGLTERARNLAPGTDPAFASITWQADKAEGPELARALDQAEVTIRIVTPKKIRRPLLLRLGALEGKDQLALSGLASPSRHVPWSTIVTRWGRLRAHAAGASKLPYELRRVPPREDVSSFPVREGRIDVALIQSALTATVSLLSEMARLGEQRATRCVRRIEPDPLEQVTPL